MTDPTVGQQVRALTAPMVSELKRMQRKLNALEAGAGTGQLNNASLTGTTITVYDDDGETPLQTIGKQTDGTVGTVAMNGPVPPKPSAPVLTPGQLSLTVAWDGTFLGADGVAVPRPTDLRHVEVHVSTSTGFVPDASTLQGTLAEAGSLVVQPLTVVAQYVRLVSVTTSSVSSDPSTEATATPEEVVASDILDGIVTTLKLANNAVTNAKIADTAVDANKLADGSVSAAKVVLGAIGTDQLSSGVVTSINTAASNAATAITAAATAQTAADAAQATADGAIRTYYQATAPTGLNNTTDLGDLWFDTDNNQAYRWSGTDWVLIQDNTIAQALAAAQNAQTTADGKIVSYFQGTAPAGAATGDLWYDTAHDNRVSWWNGTTWTPVQMGTDAIADAAVTAAQLGAAAVTTAKIASAAVTSALLADDAVIAGKLADGSVDASTLFGTGVVGTTAISDGAITTGKVTAGAIGTTELAANSVTAGKLSANAVTAASIQAGTITATEIAADTITAAQVAAGAISTSELAAGAVTAAKITAGTITATELAADTITADRIAAGAIGATELAANSVVAGKIAAGVVDATALAAGSVTTAKLDALAVTSDKVAANAITAGKIEAGSVTAAKLESTMVMATEMQSTDYAPGTAGWHISGDGSAEFNDVSLTGGSLEVTQTGEGLFVYDGSPTLGNLIVSIASAAGTDDFGNAYPKGVDVNQGSIAGSSITIEQGANNGIFVYADAPPTTTTFNSGSGTWVCPAGVTSVKVECWGGGGGGGIYATYAGGFGGGGGGGGGGEYAAEPTLSVTPGNSYAYSVGAGGPVGAGGTESADGGDTTFGGTLVVANGGSGGSSSGSGGIGGSGSSNSIHYKGADNGWGSGLAVAAPGSGGGGGGSGGYTSAGNEGANAVSGTVAGTGGAAVSGGGAGGKGGNSTTAGVAGGAPGGGGGGAGSKGRDTAGKGANGRITITTTSTGGRTLIASIASVAGTDTYGNAYPQGLSAANPTFTGTVNVQGNLAVSGIGQVRYAKAVAAQNVSNNVTPQNDNTLVLPLVANASYEVEFWVYFQTTAACDIRTDWLVPAGWTGLKACIGATDTAADYTDRQNTRARLAAHGFGTDVIYQLETGGVDQLCYERGIITTDATAGNLVFRWAQSTAAAGNLTRDSNSYMKVTRIA